MSLPTLLPAWRNIERAIIDDRAFTWGDVIAFDDLHRMLQLPRPDLSGRADVMEQWRLRILQELTALKRHMLSKHNMMLETEPGVGLRIVMPCDQTALSEAIFRRDLAKTLRSHRDRITCVDHTMLTAEQRRENTDAQTRLAARATALRQIEHSRLLNITVKKKPK